MLWRIGLTPAVAALLVVAALVSCLPQMTSATTSANATVQVKRLVRQFGQALKEVPLLAPPEVASKALREAYAPFVAPALLSRWMADPSDAPGRLTSSPWPEQIDITAVAQTSNDSYRVEGAIILMTSVEVTGGGMAGKVPITLTVERREAQWLITDVARAGR